MSRLADGDRRANQAGMELRARTCVDSRAVSARAGDASDHDKTHRNYGLIGDCETAALVSRAGSVDWLCWPRFDSGAVFAALLGNTDNGHWSIAPNDPAPRVHRRYRGNTLILETTFETAEGSVTLIDFMPCGSGERVTLSASCRGGTGG
jgi:GH15 family glucan-1,4-alpha-glucosidase